MYDQNPPKKETKKLSRLAEADKVLRRPLTPKVKSPIKESFRWMIPEFETLPLGEKSVKVKGVALPGDIISRNNRKYLESELIRAARTLSGKPFTVNHNDDFKIGNVIHAEYEDGAIEYLAQIKNARYAEMLRNKDPSIKGVSVQAGYLRLRCSVCGERFFGEDAWRHHMKEAHGIVDGVQEVHGIMFDALSLVTSPETPGVPGATIQIAETDQTVMRLCETVLKEKGISAENIGVSKGRVHMPKKLGEPFAGYADFDDCVAKNQDKQNPEAYCASIERKTEEQACPEGEYRNPETGECEPIKDKATKEVFRRLRLLEQRVGQRESDYDALKELNTKFLEYQLREAEQTPLPQSGNDDLKEALVKLDQKLDQHIKMHPPLTQLEKLIETVGQAQKRVTETAKRLKETENLTVRQDNLEAKLGKLSEFKGRSIPVTEGAAEYSSPEPPKKKKK